MKRGMTIKSSVEPMVVTMDASTQKIVCVPYCAKFFTRNGLEGTITYQDHRVTGDYSINEGLVMLDLGL